MVVITERVAMLECRLFPALERNLGPSLDSAISLTFVIEETILLA